MSNTTPESTRGALPMTMFAVLEIRHLESDGRCGAAIARRAEMIALAEGETVVDSTHVDRAAQYGVSGMPATN